MSPLDTGFPRDNEPKKRMLPSVTDVVRDLAKTIQADPAVLFKAARSVVAEELAKVKQGFEAAPLDVLVRRARLQLERDGSGVPVVEPAPPPMPVFPVRSAPMKPAAAPSAKAPAADDPFQDTASRSDLNWEKELPIQSEEAPFRSAILPIPRKSRAPLEISQPVEPVREAGPAPEPITFAPAPATPAPATPAAPAPPAKSEPPAPKEPKPPVTGDLFGDLPTEIPAAPRVPKPLSRPAVASAPSIPLMHPREPEQPFEPERAPEPAEPASPPSSAAASAAAAAGFERFLRAPSTPVAPAAPPAFRQAYEPPEVSEPREPFAPHEAPEPRVAHVPAAMSMSEMPPLRDLVGDDPVQPVMEEFHFKSAESPEALPAPPARRSGGRGWLIAIALVVAIGAGLAWAVREFVFRNEIVKPVAPAPRKTEPAPAPVAVPAPPPVATAAPAKPGAAKPAAAPAKPAPALPKGKAAVLLTPDWAGKPTVYVIHFSSTKDRESAAKEAQKLGAQLGTTARAVEVDLGEKGVWYRVVVGDFPDVDAARAYRAQLEEKKTPGMGFVYEMRGR